MISYTNCHYPRSVCHIFCIWLFMTSFSLLWYLILIVLVLYSLLIISCIHYPYKEDGQGESLLDIFTIDSMVTVMDAVYFMKDIQVSEREKFLLTTIMRIVFNFITGFVNWAWLFVHWLFSNLIILHLFVYLLVSFFTYHARHVMCCMMPLHHTSHAMLCYHKIWPYILQDMTWVCVTSSHITEYNTL